MPDPVPDQRDIARQTADASTFNTLVPSFEERLIIVAEGIQFHKDQMRAGNAAAGIPDKSVIIPDYLQDKLGSDVNIASDGTITFASLKQRVNFTLRFVTKKSEYQAALQTPGAHVVYNGHARYGRGPCFGDDPARGNQWGNGTGTTGGASEDGMFRFAFPFLAVPLSEILEHGYFADPVSADDSKPPREDCHPDIRAHYSGLKPISLGKLKSHQASPSEMAGMVEETKDERWLSQDFWAQNKENLLSVTGDQNETYWSYGASEDGHRDTFIVMHAGFQKTATDPRDLAGTLDLDPEALACRVLCHFGCSSFIHNFPVLRKVFKWTHFENERYAFWCTNTSDSTIDARWIHRLFTYPKDNAFESWKGSLDYAVAKTNADLRNHGARYQVI